MSATIPVEEWIDLVRQFETVDLLFRPLFPEEGVMGTTAAWTVFPDAQQKADYAHNDAASNRVARAGMYQRAAAMTHIRESVPVKATQKFNRVPGGNPTQPWAIEDQIADEFARMTRRFQRTREAERAGVIFGGVISMFYPANSMWVSIDFGTSTATHLYSAGTAWSTPSANILSDIDTMTYKLQVDGGTTPWGIVGGLGLWMKLIQNTDLKYYLHNHPDGLAALKEGRIPMINGVPIYEYRHGYKNSAGTWVPYVPANYVAMIGQPSEIGLKMLQGEAMEVEARGNPGVFAKTWLEQDPSAEMALMDEQALPIIEVPAGVVCMTST
jgi:hypothetical protein